MDFNAWRNAADANLKRRFAIDFIDAGFEDAMLETAWTAGESPDEFVERIATKYDLDLVTPAYVPNP